MVPALGTPPEGGDTYSKRAGATEAGVRGRALHHLLTGHRSDFTTGELVRSVGTVGVVVALLFLGDALVVATAELVWGADR